MSGVTRFFSPRNLFRRIKSFKLQNKNEIRDEQQIIREGQMQVREKFEAIESETEELKRETEELKRETEELKREARVITQQSAETKIKLALLFRILKAREQADFSTAANLTLMLRETVRTENEERDASDDN